MARKKPRIGAFLFPTSFTLSPAGRSTHARALFVFSLCRRHRSRRSSRPALGAARRAFNGHPQAERQAERRQRPQKNDGARNIALLFARQTTRIVNRARVE